jgi:hypothetical protein
MSDFNPYRKFKQRDCPACLDLSWVDDEGEEHIVFNICDTHLQMGEEENERDFGKRRRKYRHDEEDEE